MKYRLLIQRTINDNALEYVVISECKNYKSLTDSRRKLNSSANLSIHPLGFGDFSDTPNGVKARNSVDWQGDEWCRNKNSRRSIYECSISE